MKKTILTSSVVSLLMLCSNTYAATGQFFNVGVSGYSAVVSTTVPNHTYANASIRVNTPGYAMYCASTGGLVGNASNCLFSANTNNQYFPITGPTGPVNITLCLDGIGAINCQNYNIDVTAMAYVTSLSNNAISYCPILSDHTFGTCTTSSAMFNAPDPITFNNAGTYAYVGNFGGGNVSVCPVSQIDGTLGTCTTTKGSNNVITGNVRDVTLNLKNTYAYVAANSTVIVCPVLSNGLFGECTVQTDASFDASQSVQLTPNGEYLYVGNRNTGLVSICSVDQTNGLLTSCYTNNGDGTFVGSLGGIQLKSLGTVAYVAGTTNNTISLCSADPVSGNLSNCSSEDGNGTFDFASQNTHFFVANPYPYAYVPSYDAGTVVTCPINRDNSFGTCFVASGSTTFNHPIGVYVR